jgi:hypothetical protein
VEHPQQPQVVLAVLVFQVVVVPAQQVPQVHKLVVLAVLVLSAVAEVQS